MWDNDSDEQWDFDDDDPSVTVPCPECGADMFEDAIQCPSCKTYVSDNQSPWTYKSKPIQFLFAAITILLIIIMLLYPWF